MTLVKAFDRSPSAQGTPAATRKHRMGAAGVLICFAVAAGPAYAAEPDEATEARAAAAGAAANPGVAPDETTAEQTMPEERTAEEKAAPAGRNRQADGPSAEVFKPSEQISEDLAVAFPVDI